MFRLFKRNCLQVLCRYQCCFMDPSSGFCRWFHYRQRRRFSLRHSENGVHSMRACYQSPASIYMNGNEYSCIECTPHRGKLYFMETVLLRYDSTSSHMVIPPSDYQVTSHQTQPAIKKNSHMTRNHRLKPKQSPHKISTFSLLLHRKTSRGFSKNSRFMSGKAPNTNR